MDGVIVQQKWYWDIYTFFSAAAGASSTAVGATVATAPVKATDPPDPMFMISSSTFFFSQSFAKRVGH